jgi:hypothetical protein
MKHIIGRYMIIMGLAVAGLIWNGEIQPISGGLMATAEAVVGAPATPVSYAGVARRTTVRVATPGVGAPGVGAAPANRGGPVNRVGVR